MAEAEEKVSGEAGEAGETCIEKQLCISGPVQLKPMFKGQLYVYLVKLKWIFFFVYTLDASGYFKE